MFKAYSWDLGDGHPWLLEGSKLILFNPDLVLERKGEGQDENEATESEDLQECWRSTEGKVERLELAL